MACTGIGSTLVFSGGISFTARIRSIGEVRHFIEDLDDTALNTTVQKRFCPDDLVEVDPVDIEIYFAGIKPPIGTKGIATITFSVDTGQLINGGVLSGSGYIKEWSTPQLAAGERKIARVQFRFDGVANKVGWTNAA